MSHHPKVSMATNQVKARCRGTYFHDPDSATRPGPNCSPRCLPERQEAGDLPLRRRRTTIEEFPRSPRSTAKFSSFPCDVENSALHCRNSTEFAGSAAAQIRYL